MGRGFLANGAVCITFAHKAEHIDVYLKNAAAVCRGGLAALSLCTIAHPLHARMATLGLGRIVALHDRSSALYHIH